MLRTRMAFGTATLTLAAACAGVPTLQFNTDDAGGVSAEDAAAQDSAIDSTSATDAGGSVDTGTGDDAAPVSDAALETGVDDAAALHKCGAKMVATCANCAGSPMLCLENGRDECVTDCEVCGAALAPCVRCLPNGRVVGECVAPGAMGGVVCGHSAERCPCSGDAGACPLFAGSDQACVDDGTGVLGCETCGEVATMNAACEITLGVFGKCQKGSAKAGVCK